MMTFSKPVRSKSSITFTQYTPCDNEATFIWAILFSEMENTWTPVREKISTVLICVSEVMFKTELAGFGNNTKSSFNAFF